MKDWRQWKIKKLGKDDYPVGFNLVKPAIRQIYYRGSWDNNSFEKAVAMVGSRRMTSYGERVAKLLAGGLGEAGYTMVSGFMYGVDTATHQACLQAGGKTVAVLGGGLDEPTPARNGKLYSQILTTGGVVLSEYKPNFKAKLWSFPERNRIVAGLSRGVVVIEAGEKSGSLITAKLSWQQKKPVMAVPGMIGMSQSVGTNWLIQNGAKLITSVSDVLNVLGEEKSEQERPESKLKLTDREIEIIKELKRESLGADELGRKLKLGAAELGVVLSELILKELVEEVNGMYVVMM